jgi:[ribosomal protein S5]-alanine N-acetyltransferase
MTGLIQHLFGVKNIYRIVEIVDAENTASINLMRSLGFRQEGHFIENILFNGKWGSEFQFALLKSNCEKRS